MTKPVTPPQNNKNVLKIAHFNDVYQVSNQKHKINGKEENIDVTKFATLLSNVKKQWAEDGIEGGLTIFSGDTFSPSFHSSITRGRHMAAVMNTLNIDISVVGNHEFDFGYPRLKELINDTKFPWLLSNIVDKNTDNIPEPLVAYHVIEKAGVRIGLVGLVEKEWIATITGWPDNFAWVDMALVGKELSKVLRGSPHNCDLVIALTHSRIPNDIKLAEELHALAPGSDIASEHGVDLILGGHDHIYWISKGLGSWDGYDVNLPLPYAESDKGNTLIVKSGTDFQELSEVTLTLKDTPSGSVRKKLIESISGIRHITTGDLAADPEMQKVIEHELADVNAAMADPICISEVELDARSSVIRTGESAVGNWFADCLKPVYNDVLEKLKCPAVDCVVINAGCIRGDSTYAKGPITLGNLMQMLPYDNPMVVVEMDGEALWTAMESALSKWPAQEGRFPAISGFRVEWKASKDSGQRVEKMWLREETKEVELDGKPKLIDKEEIKRNRDRKYIVAIGEYMSQGGDGYTVLKEQRLILNSENGQPTSALIRKFLLGAHFVNKVSRDPEAKPKNLRPETLDLVSRARTTFSLPQLGTSIMPIPKIPEVKKPQIPYLLSNMPNAVLSLPKLPSIPWEAIQPMLIVPCMWVVSTALETFALHVAEHEDVNIVDGYERRRRGIQIEGHTRHPIAPKHRLPFLSTLLQHETVTAAPDVTVQEQAAVDKDLPVISPVIDGRLKNLDG